MVQMLVKMPGGVAEWGLVELQGQLETREQVPLDGMHIGDLHFNSKGTPSFILGHHLLTGKVVDLEKPYAILKKSTKSDLSADGMELDSDIGQELVGGGACTEYEVVALISKKIIFKNRPKPIVKSAQK